MFFNFNLKTKRAKRRWWSWNLTLFEILSSILHSFFYILWINTILLWHKKKNHVLNSELFYDIKMISKKKEKKVCGSLMPEIDPKHFMKKIYIYIYNSDRDGKWEKWKWNGQQNWNNFSFVVRFSFISFVSTHIHQIFIFFFLLSFVNVDQLIALWTINFRFMWTFNFLYPSCSPFYVIKTAKKKKWEFWWFSV